MPNDTLSVSLKTYPCPPPTLASEKVVGLKPPQPPPPAPPPLRETVCNYVTLLGRLRPYDRVGVHMTPVCEDSVSDLIQTVVASWHTYLSVIAEVSHHASRTTPILGGGSLNDG